MVASAVGEVAPRGGVAVCSGEDDGVEDSVVGWEVLAVAACLTMSVRLRRGMVAGEEGSRRCAQTGGQRGRDGGGLEEEEDGSGSATYGRGWLGFLRCRPSSTSMPGRGTHGSNHGT